MNVRIAIPKEVPNKPEKGDVKIKREERESEVELMKVFNTEVDEDDNLRFAVEKGKKLHVVSLSGELNFKAVTNWMRKHMEAYPELSDGFFVKFIDGDEYVGYKVEVCGEDEKGEKINGVNYRIIPYNFYEYDEDDEGNMGKVNRAKRKVKNLPEYENNFSQIDPKRGVDNTFKYDKGDENSYYDR